MKYDKVLDDLQALNQELEAKEAEEEVAKVTLATRHTLFPLWTLERIKKEAIDESSTYWLEPSVSFELDNTVEFKLGIPLTLRAFLL